jgi:hypothetical protein
MKIIQNLLFREKYTSTCKEIQKKEIDVKFCALILSVIKILGKFFRNEKYIKYRFRKLECRLL